MIIAHIVYVTLPFCIFTSVASFGTFHSPIDRNTITPFYEWEIQDPQSLNFFKGTTKILIISRKFFENAIIDKVLWTIVEESVQKQKSLLTKFLWASGLLAIMKICFLVIF